MDEVKRSVFHHVLGGVKVRKVRQVVLAFMFLAVVSGCRTPEPTTRSTKTAGAEKAPADTPISIASIPTPDASINCKALTTTMGPGKVYQLKEGQYFVENQIIVTGHESDIKKIIQALDNELSSLGLGKAEPTGRIDLDYLGADSISAFGGSASDLTIQLYTLPPSNIFTEIVSQIYQISVELKVSQEIDFGVFVDLNYLTGRFPVEGQDPWSVGGDPNTGAGKLAPADLFKRQWALGNSKIGGIGLFDTENGGVDIPRLIQSEGAGVTVAIFDTSPFSGPGGWKISWVTPEMNICVSHPGPVVWPVSPQGWDDVQNHGLFGAGLVHAIAPQSEIQLIRVLNNQNQGHLFWLISALSLFMEQSLKDHGTLDKTVINLSLGIHGPDRLDWPQETKDLILQQVTQLDSGPLSGSGVPVMSLKAMIKIAQDKGAVIVASAGNNLENQDSQETQIPARYSDVIGVKANNNEGNRACFSKEGDIAAPSGEGTSGDCKPAFKQCSGVEDCEYALTSLVLNTDSKYPTGYAYWGGTSFSAAQVSGLAALLFEKNSGQGSAADIVAEILDSACPSRGGIINLPHALLGTPCPTPTP